MGSIFAMLLLYTPEPPGHGMALRQVEPDGSEVTTICRGDSFDIYHGKKEITSFAVSPRTFLALAWFVLWRWFVRATWCGLKPRLWFWVARRERGKRSGKAEVR